MIELLILKNLVYSHDYSVRVMPYLKNVYFENTSQRIVFSLIYTFVHKYTNLPTVDALRVSLDRCKTTQTVIDETEKILDYIDENKILDDVQYMIDETEKWSKERALYLALTKCVSLMDDSKDDKKKNKLSINCAPQILTDALSVSFNSSIGHDYFDDWKLRLDYYKNKSVYKIPFHLKLFNECTNGGIENKTLNVFMAGPGVGKTMLLCDFASHYIMIGKRVLYITLEISEININKRIDANLLNLDIDALSDIPDDIFEQKLNKLKSNPSLGRLKVKEYPTTMGNVNIYRALLNDLKIKSGFKPDIIINDYININSSVRFADNDTGNTYGVVKSICEELRALAVEQNVPMISATQTNRGDFDSSDISMKSTAESWGLPMTCDFLTAFIKTKELEMLHQIQVSNLKTRYGDINKHRKFLIGYDTRHMRYYDLDSQDINKAQTATQQTKFKSTTTNVITKPIVKEPDTEDLFFNMKHNDKKKNFDF